MSNLARAVLADANGIESLTMRRLADELKVAPMALYRHVAHKEDLVDAMVELVYGEFGRPSTDVGWREAMRRRAVAVVEALTRHRWAVALIESRPNPGPENLAHQDAVAGCLRAGGFDVAGTAHAYSLIDGYVFGFAVTRVSLPFETADEGADMADRMLHELPAETYPHLAELLVEHVLQPGYDYFDEFELGLDIILDALERRRAGE